MYQWDDGTMGYFAQYHMNHKSSLCTNIRRAGPLRVYACTDVAAKHFLCEGDKTKKISRIKQRGVIRLSKPSTSFAHVMHVVCPSGHWTHTFLACDVLSDCWGRGALRQGGGSDAERNMTSFCRSTLSTLFTCRNGVEYVPYSLVCDHSPDCQDSSDEDFCVYPSCSHRDQFECNNKQV